MKKSILSTLISFIIILLLASLCACDLFTTDDEIEYRDVDDGVAFYRYEGNSSHDVVTVPDEYEGKPVVEISQYAISAAEYLVTINIGKNVSRISDRAFCGTYKKLTAFNVDPDNPYYCSIDGVLFTKDGKTLVAYPNKRASTDYVIPDGVETVANCAFYMCNAPEHITLSDSVTEIGDYAFFKCSGLKTLVLNEGLRKIGRDGCSFAESLTELHLPSTIETIGDFAFYSNTSSITSFTTKKPISQISCGKNWRPQTTGMENSAIEPVLEGDNG